MRKITAMLLVLALILSLAACGGNDDAAADTGGATAPADTTTTTPDTPTDSSSDSEPPTDSTGSTDSSSGTPTPDVSLPAAPTPQVKEPNLISLWRNERTPFAVQDGLLYFLTKDGSGLFKRPVAENDITASQLVFANSNGSKIVLEDLQVLGDWLYIITSYHIYRVGIDGKNFKRLVDDKASDTLVVIFDNSVYYVTEEKTQLSASKYEYSSALKKYDMESGTVSEVGRLSLPFSGSMSILAYTSDLILLKWEDKLYTYTVGTGEFAESAQFPVSPSSRDIYFSGNNCIYYLDHTSVLLKTDMTDIYRFSPDNGYQQELIFSATTDTSYYPIGADYGRVYLSFSTSNSGICYLEDGVMHTINEDYTRSAFTAGEHIYYSFGMYNDWYRVKPDGSGWGKVDY